MSDAFRPAKGARRHTILAGDHDIALPVHQPDLFRARHAGSDRGDAGVSRPARAHQQLTDIRTTCQQRRQQAKLVQKSFENGCLNRKIGPRTGFHLRKRDPQAGKPGQPHQCDRRQDRRRSDTDLQPAPGPALGLAQHRVSINKPRAA